eukprot:7171055-Karenia_brevis.AAC.1
MCPLTASQICSSDNCSNLVRNSSLCIPCSSGWKPCSNIHCRNRALNADRCDRCPFVLPEPPEHGVKRSMVPASKVPCTSHTRGCRNFVRSPTVTYCRACVMKGCPCLGPDAKGCANKTPEGYCRRALPGNGGLFCKCGRKLARSLL